MKNIDRYKKDLEALIKQGEELLNAIQYENAQAKFLKEAKKLFKEEKELQEFLKKIPNFSSIYQQWYSEAQVVIKQLMPERLEDFVRHYEKPLKPRKEIDFENYVIADCLQGLRVTRGVYKEVVADGASAIPQFVQQLNILKALQRRFESSLFNIQKLVMADVFDSELEAAKELLKHKFNRASGAICGVVLEKHLAQVCLDHNVKVAKKDPSINDFNQLLKDQNIIDMPQWRFIQHLADIRNKCDHHKQVEPTVEEINDLIAGVDKVMKTVS